MKITIFIWCLFLFSFAMGQKKRESKSMLLGGYNYAYDTANCHLYYEKAKSLIELNNPDSSYKAKKIMLGLYFYDTVKYTYKFFKPLVDKIEQSNRHFYINKIKGTWRFSHDFWTGLVPVSTSTTAIDTGKVVKFNGSVATFYFNDTLTRQTAYKVLFTQRGAELGRYLTYSICFDDSNEDWEFTLKQEKGDSTLSMIRTLDPSCSCSCGVHIYKKINDGDAPLMVNRK